MNAILKSLYTTLFLLVTITAFTSCEEDDNWRIADTLEGEWIVTDAIPAYGECPYAYGDVFFFYPDGRLKVYGYGGLEEDGYWDIRNSRLYIDFDLDGYDDISAGIRQMDYGFLELNMNDYSFDSKYILRIAKH